jgi:hypothetical protein
MPHGIHTKRTTMASEHTASRDHKKHRDTSRFGLCLSVVAFDFFLSFGHFVLCMISKGPAWSAIPIRNTKRLNFCEQDLQDTVPKALHDQQFQLETLRDLIFVNKIYKILTSPEQLSGLPNLFELHTDDQCYLVASVVGTHHVVVVYCICDCFYYKARMLRNICASKKIWI